MTMSPRRVVRIIDTHNACVEHWVEVTDFQKEVKYTSSPGVLIHTNGGFVKTWHSCRRIPKGLNSLVLKAFSMP